MMKFPEDYLDWDKYAEDINEIEELSPLEKSQAREAFQYLSKILGEDFLRRIDARVAPKGRHPFFHLLFNRAPWTRREIVRWAERIRTLQGSTNLNQLLAKLEDPMEFAHSDSVLESAARLVHEGLRASFEPTVPIVDNQKQPDVRFNNRGTEEAFFLEVAILTSPKRAQEAFEAMNAVTSRFMFVGLGIGWSGRMFKTPSALHLQEMLGTIDQTLKRVGEEKGFVEISEEGTFEIAFCHQDKADLLAEWCSTRALKPGEFMGPPVDINEVERLKRKIEKEQRQLPKDQPNAILIEYTDIFIYTRDMRKLISELEEEVYEHPHVPFVIVRGTILGGGPPNVVQKGEHRYALRHTNLIGEHSLVLINRFSPTKFSADLFAKVLRAF